ncbi:unnamed protein product [Symbiodinium natans]|uniref:Tyr recombinase domain-containing protein n=1 Tax=Symbiodinium natans TaxID=878477 RepID=A0A812M075_9DINO|nr:unnamed protein product [Symbiodinium natans]
MKVHKKCAFKHKATKKGVKKKSSKKTAGVKLGKAATLPADLWGLWIKHVLQHGRCWLFVACVLSHLLCLRVTECLRLEATDFDMKSKSVLIAPLKRQAAVRKPLLANVKRILESLRRSGIQKKRAVQQGGRGRVVFIDKWVWPKKGLLFPSERPDSKTEHRCKDTVCKAISRLRVSFQYPTDGNIRSHTARHSMVNTLKISGVPENIGMYYARIKDPKVYRGYGGLTAQQASALLHKHRGLNQSLAKHKKVALGKIK